MALLDDTICPFLFYHISVERLKFPNFDSIWSIDEHLCDLDRSGGFGCPLRDIDEVHVLPSSTKHLEGGMLLSVQGGVGDYVS